MNPASMNPKSNLQLKMATLLTVSGVVLLFCGFWVDPEGEIHASILVAFGEISTFAGALFGVEYCYRWHNTIKREK